ncbi:MAG: 50S ribosomal protein L19 [Endomicrobiia bacterium]
MNSDLTELIPREKKTFPDFSPGDTIKVYTKIREGDIERIQAFEGIVIRRHGRNLDETFTVRKISFGVGVERIFPLHSPNIEKIEVIKKGSVRRAKLYYLRKIVGKMEVDTQSSNKTQKEE